MLFKRTTVAMALAAALLALAPAAPAVAADPGVPSPPGAPVASGVQVTSADGPAAAPGSWAIVSWGFQHGSASNAAANSTSWFWYEQGSLAGVGLGCGFIGTGIGLVNPLAGFVVGFGCSWGIGA